MIKRSRTMTIDSNPSSFQDGYLEHDQIDIDLPDNNENQQGPPRNTHDLGFAGTRLIVKPDSRTELPYMLPVGHSVPIWKIIAKFVSQDLSKVSLPVVLCEPLNIL